MGSFHGSGLVKLVERTVRSENYHSPNRPIYLVGESLGACLALAVAARNPDIDLVLVLVNPATSFEKSQLQLLTPLLEIMPIQHQFGLPYILSLMTGDPLKMAFDNVIKGVPLQEIVGGLSQDAVVIPSNLNVLAALLPRETLLWKLNMLKVASTYANSHLHAVKAQTLVLSSGRDRLLPSEEEGQRLNHVLPKCQNRNFNGSEDGKVVKGLAGIPSEGPVLFVGYHMLLGFELAPMVSNFLVERNIFLRGLAHPILFIRTKKERLLPPLSQFDTIRAMGAVPVSGTNLYKLLASKAHVLLYPGGGREASHRKGEQYKLFWPEQSEFVRMAARFGAKIVPFGVVGEDDFGEVVFDYDDQMRIPFLRDYIKEVADELGVRPSSLDLSYCCDDRTEEHGEVGNQDLHQAGIRPKFPGRFYYYFGKPIETEGRKQELRDREKAHELYLQIKSEVEKCLEFLKEKRESDPYRNIVTRLSYQATHGFTSEVPTFEI
ncbi:unnamed protein product [Dovyalis caffra]|uniref:Acyltransferase n=1 Tax=Dovyalis caffra TaxID=77055 RepID=A0AAV1R7C8_9ROSI|nr:unnamed protein product [Dovyalis caffra]